MSERGSGKVARDVLESLLEGCQVIAPDWSYVYLNESAARQGGRPRDQLVGRTMMECYPGIERSPMFDTLRLCMAERTPHRMENEFTFPDGSVGWFELRFVPVPEGICILSMDITGQKRAEAALRRNEEQLVQSQKMEAIGRLAGAVAHDFNNMLSVILSYATMSRDALPEGNPLREDLQEIERAGLRARDLTAQLLTFSRQQVVQATVQNLNDTLGGMSKILRTAVGSGVELRIVLEPALGRVLCNPVQVEQILLNLVINARDAMPDGGLLTLETANVMLDEEYARAHLGVKPGPHVMIAASDTGIGMDRATQARVFEPFFTTKGAGKGTGLGLATVFGIVQQSGGSIWVYSEPGKGTTFKVYLPRTRVSGETAAARSTTPPPHAAHETILLVEDDPQLRQLGRAILEKAGYTVLAPATAAEALEIGRNRKDDIHLLLTDVIMPDMNGRELADRMRALRPAIRVSYMSGYTGDVVLHRGRLEQGVSFVQKPITPDVLLRSVREVLEEGRPAAPKPGPKGTFQ